VIQSTTKDGVAVLAMRHGKANALDTELCQALCGALDDAAAGGAAAVVLTGAETVFSAGVDLKRVTAEREGYVAAFLPELRRAFTRLATFELPVVAAVNGHAIAGGFILAAAADWAVMAEGPGRAGVTELLVGVPVPAVALELLRLRAGDAQARPLSLSGATFGAEEALARGLVDEAVPTAQLADRALAAAQRLAAQGPAFGLTKRQLRQRFLTRVHDLAVFDAEVDAIWKAPATLERIQCFMTSLK
jgi:enoyl-CoA hydratase